MRANGFGRWLTPPRASLALGGFSAVAVAAGCLLTVLAHDLRASFDGVLLLIVAIVAAVGLVVARRQPSNPIGWLLLTAAALFAGYAVAVLYAVLDYRRHGGRLPLGRVALVGEPSWVLGVVLLGLAVALFPDGRLASRRWRIPLIVYVAAGAWFCSVWALSQATLHIDARFDVDEAGNYVRSQGGFPGTAAAMAWAAAGSYARHRARSGCSARPSAAPSLSVEEGCTGPRAGGLPEVHSPCCSRLPAAHPVSWCRRRDRRVRTQSRGPVFGCLPDGSRSGGCS